MGLYPCGTLSTPCRDNMAQYPCGTLSTPCRVNMGPSIPVERFRHLVETTWACIPVERFRQLVQSKVTVLFWGQRGSTTYYLEGFLNVLYTVYMGHTTILAQHEETKWFNNLFWSYTPCSLFLVTGSGVSGKSQHSPKMNPTNSTVGRYYEIRKVQNSCKTSQLKHIWQMETIEGWSTEIGGMGWEELSSGNKMSWSLIVKTQWVKNSILYSGHK
jgi:hypothetical protein